MKELAIQGQEKSEMERFKKYNLYANIVGYFVFVLFVRFGPLLVEVNKRKRQEKTPKRDGSGASASEKERKQEREN